MLWDGSPHAWLEARGPHCCLVGAMDDATGALLPGAVFVPAEDTVSYLRLLRVLVGTCGIPVALYMDRHGIFRRNDAAWTLVEELQGHQEPTQVGRALAALGIESIYALSPQAKGRIERLWNTLQDRLVAELRLAGITTLAAANAFLPAFTLTFNARASGLRMIPLGGHGRPRSRYGEIIGVTDGPRMDAAARRSYRLPHGVQ